MADVTKKKLELKPSFEMSEISQLHHKGTEITLTLPFFGLLRVESNVKRTYHTMELPYC